MLAIIKETIASSLAVIDKLVLPFPLILWYLSVFLFINLFFYGLLIFLSKKKSIDIEIKECNWFFYSVFFAIMSKLHLPLYCIKVPKTKEIARIYLFVISIIGLFAVNDILKEYIIFFIVSRLIPWQILHFYFYSIIEKDPEKILKKKFEPLTDGDYIIQYLFEKDIYLPIGLIIIEFFLDLPYKIAIPSLILIFWSLYDKILKFFI
ncbi:NEQ094 [Nanoarchaeum equitans Kin4-M]|uniref:NEQ094 n=1 Tax=Nanoarchaeum equitans (strain Kin4-M) TaxID=228908 RepID=Q74N80_NANEQ|nr:NEQ094 [Nanoarchaeum equitans Kin4-M]